MGDPVPSVHARDWQLWVPSRDAIIHENDENGKKSGCSCRSIPCAEAGARPRTSAGDAIRSRPVTADEWIAAFAAELRAEAPDEATVGELLELAATAAHSSERIAAPIACYLVGRAGVAVDEARTHADALA